MATGGWRFLLTTESRVWPQSLLALGLHGGISQSRRSPRAVLAALHKGPARSFHLQPEARAALAHHALSAPPLLRRVLRGEAAGTTALSGSTSGARSSSVAACSAAAERTRARRETGPRPQVPARPRPATPPPTGARVGGDANVPCLRPPRAASSRRFSVRKAGCR